MDIITIPAHLDHELLLYRLLDAIPQARVVLECIEIRSGLLGWFWILRYKVQDNSDGLRLHSNGVWYTLPRGMSEAEGKEHIKRIQEIGDKLKQSEQEDFHAIEKKLLEKANE